ncbi:DUF2934 domain-containing protein [Ensifer soli]|uniref:DUF2934 domain-containing protein n=1 Tax=Ciceribacter sp. sgz301302 TaxID=3342379 RepID=UPI0035B73BD0
MDDREHRIRKRAHALWEDDGRPDGRHEHHWQQAEEEFNAEIRHVHADTPASAELEAGTGEKYAAAGEAGAVPGEDRAPPSDPHPGSLSDGRHPEAKEGGVDRR